MVMLTMRTSVDDDSDGGGGCITIVMTGLDDASRCLLSLQGSGHRSAQGAGPEVTKHGSGQPFCKKASPFSFLMKSSHL
jgi:hypothetical protein